MSPLKVALLQMVAHGADVAANLSKGEAFCRRAAALRADIAVFPEMWSIGYAPCPPDAAGRIAWRSLAISQESEHFVRYRDLARELDLAIAVTYLEGRAGAVRNSVSLIDRHGDVRFTYSKVHTCEWGWEAECEPGDDFHVASLDTRCGPVEVGAMICFDREFPESARVLMLKGAEIILTPNACPLESNRIGQLRVRAFENMIGVATANYAAPQENGHSVACSPICFDEGGRSLDPVILEASDGEGVFVAEFDLNRLRAWRGSEVWGDAFRRPGRYGQLTSRGVERPFARAKATR